MKSLYNLRDYKLAKSVAVDFPIIIKAIDEAISNLEKYKHYKYPVEILWQLKRYKISLLTQLSTSDLVLSNKGKK